MITRNNRQQPASEPLGAVRRHFYDIYTLVRHALPDDTSHKAICDLLSELALATYMEADKDKESMERLWEGRGR